eukprot:scaffold1228_cov115-Isochrysis_galbana.AAC.2
MAASRRPLSRRGDAGPVIFSLSTRAIPSSNNSGRPTPSLVHVERLLKAFSRTLCSRLRAIAPCAARTNACRTYMLGQWGVERGAAQHTYVCALRSGDSYLAVHRASDSNSCIHS